MSEELNISCADVKRITDRYIELVRAEVLSGREVHIFGLVSLVPDVVVDSYVSTTALYAKTISKELGIPYHTVMGTLREYINSLKETLLEGKNITICRIVGVYPTVTEEGIRIYTRISESIRTDLYNENSCVTSVRAHTNKLFKEFVLSTTKPMEKEE